MGKSTPPQMKPLPAPTSPSSGRGSVPPVRPVGPAMPVIEGPVPMAPMRGQ